MTLESIRTAMLQAEPFFDHFYPGPPFLAYVCDSWLFSTQIEGMLGADSNIVRWQHEGYLYPSGGGPEDFLNFTFGAASIDVNTRIYVIRVCAAPSLRLCNAMMRCAVAATFCFAAIYLALAHSLTATHLSKRRFCGRKNRRQFGWYPPCPAAWQDFE